MPKNIDVDRGVTIKMHEKYGMYIYMYKDTPGVYLDTFGKEVPAELAKEAGYDINKLGKSRQYMEKLNVAKAAIAAELEQPAEDAPKKVVKERDGIRVVDMGRGRFLVETDEGPLTDVPLAEDTAMGLLDTLAPEAPKAAKPAPKKVPKEAE